MLYLNKHINIFFAKKNFILNIKGFYNIIIYKLPSFFFYNLKFKKSLKIIFLKKDYFINLFKYIINISKNLINIYCIYLRIKGLGYRIRKITNKLYYFFFNYTNMYYFYLPKNILLKWLKKKILLISNNINKLKVIFTHLLILKNIGVYRLRGLRYNKQIIFIKKGNKKIK